MKKHLLFLGALVMLTITACKHPTVFKEVLAPKMFSMQVPAYMKATTELFPGGKACIQYENDSAQIYLIVFDSTRENIAENSIRAFYDSVVTPASPDAKVTAPKLTMIKGDSALVSEMTATLSGTPVFYRMEVISTPERFYYILLWCKQDKKDELKKDFDKILDSFTDINHNKV